MRNEEPLEEGEVIAGDFKTLLKRLTDPRAKTMYSILELLLQHTKGEPVPAGEIKDKLGISKQAATNAARRLEEGGLITRTSDGYMINLGFLISLLIQIIGDLLRRLEA
ncbi:MAG: MarR family transcriptional regulator [Candidatus Jordarchaeum sp.]|uniref:MarR family transcriptional regulator n=1 Tax=Candidatus Jordarchaeum sp. TaxID=2823881 RepID=UPI00404A4461